MQHFECCQNALEASNLVKTCFLTSVLTWERLSFTFQTHNSHLLDPHFSTIFNIQKCNNFVVFSDSANASEKVDLVLFLWSSRLVETYPKTSFDKSVLFKALKLEKLENANFAHFVSHPLDGNVPKDLFWQNWRLLRALKLKSLKKQTLLILWAARLVETYPKTSFDKTGGFWKL